jgi:hypothetical protein
VYALSLGAVGVEDVLRAVRALGAHRYVAGRLLLVHAFAAEAVGGEAGEWAKEVLGNAGVEKASRDERLWRRATEAEAAAVLEAFWAPGEASADARERLAVRLRAHGLAAPEHAPFNESAEEEMHPVLVDAGWELLPLAALDPERHRGAIGAFGEAIAYESARFEEETAIPAPTTLIELPAIGAAELLGGVDDDGRLVEPFVVWAQGHETYVDYVIRGVRRAAKLSPPLPDPREPGSS